MAMPSRYVLAWALACGLCALAGGCGGSDSGTSGAGGAGGAGGGSTTSTGSTSTGTTSSGDPGGDPLGEKVDGEYNLGPVEWTGSFWNACAPYPDSIAQLDGTLLAGVSDAYGADGSYCDACIQVVTAMGKSLIARVVTYGQTTAPGNIDVSQAAFDLLDQGEYPRTMTWQLVACPASGPLYYQFQTGANAYWTSLWVRNPRIAIESVAVKSANHADFAPIDRGPDGTFTDAGGFGEGAFTLRVTGVDGSSVEQAFDGFTPGELTPGAGNL